MLKKIFFGLVLLIGVLAIVIASQPTKYSITRSISIPGSADAPYALVNDLHSWREWSPWEDTDPQMQRTYSENTVGVGAWYAWKGNMDVGEGKMTIVESKLNELIRIKLEFFAPFASLATADFTFATQGADTSVTWSMYGERNFIGKALCMVMNMEDMVGPQFQKGLERLKLAALPRPAGESPDPTASMPPEEQ